MSLRKTEELKYVRVESYGAVFEGEETYGGDRVGPKIFRISRFRSTKRI